jgi:hypothetical protein
MQPEMLGSLLRDAHLHLQRKSSEATLHGDGAGDGARGSAGTNSSGGPREHVPAVYSYGEGSLGEEGSDPARRVDHVFVDVPDDEAGPLGGISSALVRFDQLTVTTPPRHTSSTAGTPGESGGGSDANPGPHGVVQRLRQGDRTPLTPPHGHPHYTVVAGIRSP